ncbi:C4-dicarboxylate ABC transporter [Rhodobacterales bacterium HKCCE2091]|nr:C4-dicarboxylate ABC transporter [Rhodobacterales bacterium HKCCE2091]
MTAQADAAAPESRLEHFPIGFFGMSMGILGLALALRASGAHVTGTWTGVVGAAVLAILLAVYALKAVRYPTAVAADWNNPVKLAFFPAASISVLLLATLMREDHAAAANLLWLIGAGVQAVMTLVVVSAWISHRAFGPGQLSPAWFIPAVGNVVAPIAGVPLGHVDLSWYFFAVGLVFWLVLLVLVFNRLIFHDPLPGRLKPTLVILIAPPAVAFLAWTALNGGSVDAAARIFLNAGYFFALLVAIQVPSLLRLPFALSFWALSFPLAALTVASFRAAALTGEAAYRGIGLMLLAVLVITIAALVVRTIRAALAREICVPE